MSISELSLGKHAIAWAAIKCYYAAFFAAHAILRLAGIAVTYVDSDLASDLTKIWESYGIKAMQSIGGGSYEIRVLARSSVMCADKRHTGSSSHAALWRAFIMFIDSIVELIADDNSATRGAMEYIPALTRLKKALCADDTLGLWLNETRNAINYRQTHGVWFPYSGRDRLNFSTVRGEIQGWHAPADPLRIGGSGKDDLAGVFRTSIFMVAMCREFVESLARSSRRSFVSNYSFKLINLARSI